jgi:hypothetical protein
MVVIVNLVHDDLLLDRANAFPFLRHEKIFRRWDIEIRWQSTMTEMPDLLRTI